MATTYPQPEYGKMKRSDILGGLLSRGITLNWYTIAFIAIFLIAVFTRFYDLGTRAMSHDESLHTYYSYLLAENGDFDHTPLMHGPILFHVTAFFYFLFGDSDFTARIYPALVGIAMVMFPLLFRRWLGRTGALLASILVLISPLLLYHHRYIREDTPAIFATIVMVYCTFMYIDGPMHLRRKARWLYLFSGAMLWNLASKETAFMYVAIFGLFMTLYWVARLYQHFRKVPGKTLFYYMVIPGLIGGAAALIMYIVLSIPLATYATLPSRLEFLGEQIRNIGSVAPSPEFSLFTSWTLLLIAALVTVIFGTMLWAFRSGRVRLRVGEALILLFLTLFVTSGLIVVEELAKLPQRADEVTVDPENDVVDVVAERSTPIIATWVVAAGLIALLLYSWRAGWWNTLHRFPELDIMWLMGTLILPWMTGLIVSATGASPVDYTQEGLIRSASVLIPLALISIVAGLVWNPKRWLIAAAVFHILFAFFYTTMFTNPNGLATGMIGSLGYWLEQQGVARGGQPQYYYQLIVMPIYEYLPVIGSFIAMIAGLCLFWAFRREQVAMNATVITDDESVILSDDGELLKNEEMIARRKTLWGVGRLRRMSFPLFVSWWSVYIFISFTLAGEKMPWLGTHLTLPMILLAAWVFGRIFESVDWALFRKRGWLFMLLIPLLIVAVFQAISPFLVGELTIGGLTQGDLTRFNQWLAVLFVGVILIYLIFQVTRRVGARHLRGMIGVAVFAGLSLLTFRTAWMAAFINYDYATEYLVYAHGAPGIKLMMEQIEDLSRRTAGGMGMRFAWGGNSWPVTWYFRDLTNTSFFAGNPTPDAVRDAVAVYASEDIRPRVEPLLEDRYYRFEYMRMWWPSWNYYNLNAQRVTNTFDFSATNTQAAQIRRGIWDIFWARDFTRYGEAVGESFAPADWSPGERLYFYVRKDIAAQLWNLGVGEGVVMNPLEGMTVSVCTDNWQLRTADVVFQQPNTDGSLMNHPLGISTDAQGRVFVAEEFGNRVVTFDSTGNVLGTIDGFTGGTGLNRPNAVAVAPDGRLVVADTWNYRVGVYDASGEFVRGWGQAGQFGDLAQTEPTDGFWGPRSVAVDSAGNIYVSDTGNKRVRVYNANGDHLRDIGSSGAELGQLNEPSGVVVSPDNRLFVADTWNQRVSVFNTDGTPMYTFPVRGWYEDLGNRPYLALDAARNLLYVTDPDAGRVLVYDLEGNCVGSFGQPAEDALDSTQFETVGGIAVDANGFVYVSDSEAGRVLRFAPFAEAQAGLTEGLIEGAVLPADGIANDSAAFIDGAVEAMLTEALAAGDVLAESSPESLPEVTAGP